MRPDEPDDDGLRRDSRYNINTPDGALESFGNFTAGLSSLSGWRRTVAKAFAWIALAAIAFVLLARFLI